MHHFHRQQFRYTRVSTRARPVLRTVEPMPVEHEPELPIDKPRQPDELPFRFPPIDLNKVPSSMEQLAASWRKQE